MTDAPYRAIVSHYESCLRTHGDGARAVDWNSAADAAIRYDVMLGVARGGLDGVSLLDFGCGLCGLRDHMLKEGLSVAGYTGLEISPAFAETARRRNPGTEILCMDVLESGARLPAFDYAVMNGIFTRRHSLSVAEMDDYLRRLVPVVFAACRRGVAFNVMSTSVDWESEVLYHADPGALLDFIGRSLTRHYTLRNDYGLYETTFYLYKESVVKRAVNARDETGQGA